MSHRVRIPSQVRIPPYGLDCVCACTTPRTSSPADCEPPRPYPLAGPHPLIRTRLRVCLHYPRTNKAVLNPRLPHKPLMRIGSCGLRATRSPTRARGEGPRTVFCLRLMVLVGLKATLATMVSPLASPPWMPPDLRADPTGFG